MSVNLTLTLGLVLDAYKNIGRCTEYQPPTPLREKALDILSLDIHFFEVFKLFGFEYPY